MEDLIQRARHGDSPAFVELFEHCKQPMWKAAMAVLGNVDDAADALQETAVKAWRAMPGFAAQSSVDTWLMRILLRTCFDMRRRGAHETPFTVVTGGAGRCECASSAESMLDEAHVLMGRERIPDQDEAMDVRAAVRQLCDDDRLLLTLFYVNDFPTRQIAGILNISEGAVRTRLVRARERFRTIYCGASRQDDVEQEGRVAK